MHLNESPLEYDPIINGIRLETDIELELQNEEFKNWLIDEGYYLTEETQQNWYIKWKAATIQALKTNTQNFINYSDEQIQNNSSWLEKYKGIILNFQKYPVKKEIGIKNAPNYMIALQRISRPVSNSLNGLNLSRIEISDDQVTAEAANPDIGNQQNASNAQPNNQTNQSTVIQPKTINTNNNNQQQNQDEDNTWLKKMIIPIYDGRNSFVEEAKAYYYGTDKRSNLPAGKLQPLMKSFVEYCSNYNTTIRSINNDLNGIIAFINKNPTTGAVQTNTNSDLQTMMAAQGNGGKASTNPNANAQQVNADTDYSLFLNKYFSDILNEADGTYTQKPMPQIRPVQQTSQAPTASTTKTADNTYKVNTTTPNNSHQQNTDQNINNNPSNNDDTNKNINNLNKKAADQGALEAKRKQTACNIIKDAYNAKITCMGLLYRDFMNIMESHATSYIGKKQQ